MKKSLHTIFRTNVPFGIKLCLLILVSITGFNAKAQWSNNPAVNTAISATTSHQYNPKVISDGSGGAIIAWQDLRSGNWDIYAQHIDASGAVQWTTNGVTISTASNGQQNLTIVSDGSGGAIITWQDNRSGSNWDIYAQRINSSGAVQWTTDGEAISTATNSQQFPTIVSDGSGGAIITWNDFRSGSYSDIYAQLINASGAVQWTADGVAISAASIEQYNPTIVSDGSGGAIITWMDNRSGSSLDIYAQRINASGTVQWTADGVAISTATSNQQTPTIVSDGSGGAIITWYDNRSGSSSDIYAQRIDASGAVQWTADGVAISSATGDQYVPTIVSDGSGGAIITWYDYRGSSSDIYAQRINVSGAVQWTANGEAICTATGNQNLPTIVSDGSGGAIVTWMDYRSGSNYDISAQRINASGAVQWTADGVAISAASATQEYPTIVSDGSGGAIITWSDLRSGTDYDVYAQNVTDAGTLGGTTIAILGNGNTPAEITDGDVTPSTTDSTDFGTRVINTSLVRRYTIQNNNASTLTISSIVSSGTNASEFVVSGAPSTISANSTATFIVTFTPTATSTRSATITVNSNDGNTAAYDFVIQGTGSTTYTYNGTGNWTDESNWSPSYPGTTIPSGITVENPSGNLTINTPIINNGTILNNGTLTISGGTFTNDGAYTGSGAYTGGVFVNPVGGTVNPGQ
jgi:hypothetical protein